MTQTRMEIGSLTVLIWTPDMGSMRGQYVINLSKLINVLMFFLISIIICCNTASLLFSWHDYTYQLGRSIYPDSKQNRDRRQHILKYGTHEGTICLPYSIILKFYIFSHLRYHFQWFNLFVSWNDETYSIINQVRQWHIDLSWASYGIMWHYLPPFLFESEYVPNQQAQLFQ